MRKYISQLLVLKIPSKPQFPAQVVNRLATIFADLGTLMVGSVVLPFIFDKGSLSVIVSGVTIAFIFWTTALLLLWE